MACCQEELTHGLMGVSDVSDNRMLYGKFCKEMCVYERLYEYRGE